MNRIRVFYSELSGRFYASQHYRHVGNAFVITGRKYDVTNDIGAAVTRHEITFASSVETAEEEQR